MSHYTTGNYKTALIIGVAIFVVAFVMLMFIGDYRFVAAFFLALLLALLTTIVIYLAFGMGEGSATGSASHGSASASATPAAAASATQSSTTGTTSGTGTAGADAAKAAEADAARKAQEEKAAAEAEAARKAEEKRAAAEADTAQKAAEQKKAAEAAKAEAERKAQAAAATSASNAGTEDYDGDGVLEGTNEGTRPAGLEAPRGGAADDLKMIKGVGPKLEKLCNSLGFWHFDQVAAWTADEVAWVDANLMGFKGRVSRDKWVDQANTLASGGETEFSKRVEDGDVY